MLVAVAVAKVAGLATLMILAWVVAKIVWGKPRDPEDAAKGDRSDPIGETIMRGFTWMLTVGVGAAFAISLAEVIEAL